MGLLALSEVCALLSAILVICCDVNWFYHRFMKDCCTAFKIIFLPVLIISPLKFLQYVSNFSKYYYVSSHLGALVVMW